METPNSHRARLENLPVLTLYLVNSLHLRLRLFHYKQSDRFKWTNLSVRSWAYSTWQSLLFLFFSHLTLREVCTILYLSMLQECSSSYPNSLPLNDELLIIFPSTKPNNLTRANLNVSQKHDSSWKQTHGSCSYSGILCPENVQHCGCLAFCLVHLDLTFQRG